MRRALLCIARTLPDVWLYPVDSITGKVSLLGHGFSRVMRQNFRYTWIETTSATARIWQTNVSRQNSRLKSGSEHAGVTILRPQTGGSKK